MSITKMINRSTLTVGAASVTISDFNAPEPEPESVPEPASILGLLTVGALGAGSALKRRKKQQA